MDEYLEAIKPVFAHAMGVGGHAMFAGRVDGHEDVAMVVMVWNSKDEADAVHHDESFSDLHCNLEQFIQSHDSHPQEGDHPHGGNGADQHHHVMGFSLDLLHHPQH